MLDTYDFLGDVWLCHSFGGKCHNYTAFVCLYSHPFLFVMPDVNYKCEIPYRLESETKYFSKGCGNLSLIDAF